MWPFKKKKKIWVGPLETTFSESVIVSGSAKIIECGIQETGQNSGLYTTWVRMGIPSLSGMVLHLGGLHMPRTQSTKAAHAIGKGFINHLAIQKTHLESEKAD